MTTSTLQVLLVAAGVLALALALLWSVTTIQYYITPRFLKITWMGIPIRWVRLTSIRQLTPKSALWAERWCNTFRPANRLLAVHRRRGLFKTLLISPRNPYVFRADLYRARDAMLGTPGTDLPPAFQEGR